MNRTKRKIYKHNKFNYFLIRFVLSNHINKIIKTYKT